MCVSVKKPLVRNGIVNAYFSRATFCLPFNNRHHPNIAHHGMTILHTPGYTAKLLHFV